MKKILFLSALLFVGAISFAQTKTNPNPKLKQRDVKTIVPTDDIQRPKLVVGIVVDQMRYDYLIRFWEKYSEMGFRWLINQGYHFKDANYNYVPTYTGPGHACIYTGTTPSYNGIVSNEWYDRKSKKGMYCVSDTTVTPLGTTTNAGKMSPKNLLTTTVTDELRLATNFKSKVIGISLKDRGAILPAGHTANAAYWHDPSNNNWVSSSYYMKDLPNWVNEFNKKKEVDSLLSKPWTTLLPMDKYTESTEDNNAYEGLFAGEVRPTFPHDLPRIKANDPELIRKTPFGNSFTKDFAEAAIKGEQLGKGTETDFLTVSFSSTDYVGHMYGTNAIELEDTYLRLDADLAEFITFLEEQVGQNNFLLFLTADHGAANNPVFSEDKKIPAGHLNAEPVMDSLRHYLNTIYGNGDYILSADVHDVYLNHEIAEQKHINLEEMENRIMEFLSGFEGVGAMAAGEELKKGNCKTGVQMLMQNGYYRQRSADVMIELAPAWMDWSTKTGTTHGAAYSYDTHVPLIFYGWRIHNGNSSAPVKMTDVAPTIASLLHIEFPSGCTGAPLRDLEK